MKKLCGGVVFSPSLRTKWNLSWPLKPLTVVWLYHRRFISTSSWVKFRPGLRSIHPASVCRNSQKSTLLCLHIFLKYIVCHTKVGLHYMTFAHWWFLSMIPLSQRISNMFDILRWFWNPYVFICHPSPSNLFCLGDPQSFRPSLWLPIFPL